MVVYSTEDKHLKLSYIRKHITYLDLAQNMVKPFISIRIVPKFVLEINHTIVIILFPQIHLKNIICGYN